MISQHIEKISIMKKDDIFLYHHDLQLMKILIVEEMED